MAEFKVEGSGGYVIAELTEEQAKKADLGVGKLFLAPIGHTTYLCFARKAFFGRKSKKTSEKHKTRKTTKKIIRKTTKKPS